MYWYICMYIYLINDSNRHYYEFNNKSLFFGIIRVTVMRKVQECSSQYSFTKHSDKYLLSLSDRKAPGCWVFELPPASQSAAILGENTKLKTPHLSIQKENSHCFPPTLGYDLPVKIIRWNIWQEKEKSYQYVSKFMFGYNLSCLMNASWEINCLANN